MKIEDIDCQSAEATPHSEQQAIKICSSYRSQKDVTNNSTSAAAEPYATSTTATTTKMTDERNNNSNNINNKNKKCSHNDHIITEATKIVLKNGLNGATAPTATDATLLTSAAAVINLSPHPPSTHANFALHTALPTAAAAGTTFGFSPNNGTPSTTLRTSTAATEAGSSQHQSISASATPSAASTSTTANDMAAATATTKTKELLNLAAPPVPTSCSGGSVGLKVDNGGVIDYTINSSSNDIGRNPISATNELPRGQNFGGRLQFFKDGKFILELARSKDVEKGGWVSVPRKIFRAPSSATSSTITPTSTTSTTYPKNESSTSLSFSDDNSSIQSSPWQRDHCWKQATPRYGISKEMSLFYRRPNYLTLSAIGLQASRKMRRRPFDNTCTLNCQNIFAPIGFLADKNLSTNVTLKAETSGASKQEDSCLAPKSETSKCGGGMNAEEDACSTSSTCTLTGVDCIDGSATAQPPINSTTSIEDTSVPPETSEEASIVANKEEIKAEADNAASSVSKDVEAEVDAEKMNTSEEDRNEEDVAMASATAAAQNDETNKSKLSADVKVDKVPVTPSSPLLVSEKKSEFEAGRAGGEQRLKRRKTRAKLITIIQKLIDRIPTAGLLYLSKTLQPMISGAGGGATFNHCNALTNKISPPSSSTSSPASATTSRLVELQYHQQHVSPRKRILREFEKVSLDDSGTTAAGGKRRAKGNTAAATTTMKSSPQRVQSTSCAVLTSTSIVATTATNGCLPKNAPKLTTSAPPTSSTPPRLNSSYSIHSLLGGGSSSLNASASPTSLATKRMNDHAIVSNINYQQHQHQKHNYADPSYLRAMLASPKSPENNCGVGAGSGSGGCSGGGGKSPSNLTNKKRSPPYSSPLHESHSRSPIVSVHSSSDYGRRSPVASPPDTHYKLRFAAENSVAASPSSHLPHQAPSFYSPYMTSPKYVSAPPASMSPNSTNSANAARSPRHPSVGNAHIPASSISSSAAAANCIPTRELSPPRSATAPPRDSTPRTVPKKTASIRRQFASPTSSASSSERTDEQQQHQQERKTSLTAGAAGAPALQQHSFQAVSPNPHHIGGPPLPTSPLHYYMYAPSAAAAAAAAVGSSSPNGIGPSSSNGSASAAAAAAQAAALAAAYIPAMVPPSYYHPYISTLAALRQNPLWMHHYPGVTPPFMPPHNSTSQASSRLSPPFHSFAYNGVSAATMAAAAAAAAAFAGPLPPSHLAQVGLGHPVSAPSAIHHAASAFVGGSTTTQRLTDESCVRTKTATKPTTATTILPSSIKDEQSSDVPLNLSKH